MKRPLKLTLTPGLCSFLGKPCIISTMFVIHSPGFLVLTTIGFLGRCLFLIGPEQVLFDDSLGFIIITTRKIFFEDVLDIWA